MFIGTLREFNMHLTPTGFPAALRNHRVKDANIANP